ncbi:MAG TPA: shikimate kinase [Candidatus Limnocylindrales bacterium]|nr:shikimate kinase [Candidatus Limnocylindrales bacterium]
MRRGGNPCRQAVLVGFMGAGKSSVGKILAERLAAEFIDVDERIEAAAGKSIGEIFASCGEEAFREMERAAVRDAVSVPGRVVAAGGGAFLDEANRRTLKAYAPVFFLDVSVESVLERLAEDRSRPLFTGEKEAGKLRELMDRRRPAYEEADFRVSTDDRSVPEISDRILSLLSRRGGPRNEGERA